MSALSFLCGYGYGSNSDDSDSEFVNPQIKKRKLPAPDLTNVRVVPADTHVDNTELHGGRSRSFAHERGNWATFVYVKLSDDDDLLELVEKLQEAVIEVDDSCQKCSDFHISLSKTVVLKYHQIATFSTSLREQIADFQGFALVLNGVKIYSNEDNSRTFIALKVAEDSATNLFNITKKVDDILTEFKLPIFYENPSFHMSVLWVNGNKTKELEKILNVTQELTTSLREFTVDQVHCKIGNKYFQYLLQ